MSSSACVLITKINESETLAKHISSDCKYKFDVRYVIQIKSWINFFDNVNVKI